MAITSGFFNSVNHDRMYNAVQMSQLFDGLITDGVFSAVLDHFIVTETTGTAMSVYVSSGRAWFNNTWTYNDGNIVMYIDEASPSSDRIDAIALKVDKTDDVRANSVVVVKGEPNPTSPVRPTFPVEEGVYYYPLAYILVKAGVTAITDADITNMVGTEATPFATGILQQVTTDELVRQWQAEFYDWMEGLKDILDDNVAAHLQNEIDNIIKNEFTNMHKLCNQNSTFTRDASGEIVRIESEDTDTGITSVTTYTKTNPGITVVETITTDRYIYTSTMVFDGTNAEQTYTKEAITP